jgi:uncharacterized protein
MVDYTGGTTIVTGASSGIGAEFARQLAARGSNLVLVARRKDRMTALATELETQYGITATTIPLDLEKPQSVGALRAELDKRGIRGTSLINNAGYGGYGVFHESDPANGSGQIALNVAALVALSREFIGDLRAAGSGVLVNVASTAAVQPVPYMAVYGATKAFVLSFTSALWFESRDSGLRVLALCPGATSTEFFDVVGTTEASTGNYETPEQVVSLALRTLDRTVSTPTVISGARNRFLAFAERFVSRRQLTIMTAGIMGPKK